MADIEHVAEAIWRATVPAATEKGIEFSEMAADTHKVFRHLARSAIDAINPPDRVFIDDRGHRWEWCGGEQGTWAWRMTTTSMPGASRVHPVVPCPTCHAPAGLACEDADGYRQPQAPHPARIEAFYDTTEYRGQ